MKKQTKTEPTYYELLQDPRWQKKRLQIMERDRFSCQSCGSEIKTLNVHHRWYEKDKKPWEYEDGCFITLCDVCHEEIKPLNQKLLRYIHSINFHTTSIMDLISFSDALDDVCKAIKSSPDNTYLKRIIPLLTTVLWFPGLWNSMYKFLDTINEEFGRDGTGMHILEFIDEENEK